MDVTTDRDLLVHQTDGPAPTTSRTDSAQLTYRYVRASLVGLLIGLAAAVIYQSVKQGSILTSISAYYFTAAQAVFVGALVGVGVSMVALRGTRTLDDVALNIGGMLAPVIAVVPTSRGVDFTAAVDACRKADEVLMSTRSPATFDCPTVKALTEATRVNVENNMVALFVVGGLALIVAWLFAWIDAGHRFHRSDAETSLQRLGNGFLWGFGLAIAVYALGVAAFFSDTDLFIRSAHFCAAIGLFVSIIVVVVANGARSRRDELKKARIGLLARQSSTYFVLAILMGLTALVLGTLVATHVITLFWLEAALIGLFAAFWIVQTREQWNTVP